MKLELPRARWWILALVGAGVLCTALIPVQVDSRDVLFEIPAGTWAKRRAGVDAEILPSEIRLVLGLSDILVLKNFDDVPQIFGPTLIMPGQSFRLPFNKASEYQFECTAHASGQMTVIVAEGPTTPWSRLRFRAQDFATRLAALKEHVCESNSRLSHCCCQPACWLYWWQPGGPPWCGPRVLSSRHRGKS